MCNNPAPAHRGIYCSGQSFELQTNCNNQPCPINGEWSVFGSWSSCENGELCGRDNGTRSRSRTCSNPNPAHGGKRCPGVAEESESCSGDQCCGYILHSEGKCIHPQDGSHLVRGAITLPYNRGCKEERLYFCITSLGEIRHKMSGLCIQPARGRNSASIHNFLILNSCGSSITRFRFTPGGSIQHISSGKCWQPWDGSAHDPFFHNTVVLRDGCNEERLRFEVYSV